MNLNTLTPYFKVIADAQSRALDGTCYVVRGCLPTSTGSGLQVNVTAGDSVEGGTPHNGFAGGTLTLTAAPSTASLQYRRDIIYRNSAGTLTSLAGTPALLTSTTPLPAAIPSSATLLAVCFIAPGQTVLAAVDVEDVRQTRMDGQPSVNVKAFGATGDGSTADTSAFQSALDLVDAAGGGTVLVPGPGTYELGRINIGSNTVLRGLGKGSILHQISDANEIVSTKSGANDIQIRDLHFLGRGTASAGVGYGIIDRNSAHNRILVDGCTFTNFSAGGMHIGLFTAAPGGLCQDYIVSNCHFYGNGITTGEPAGIAITNGDRIIVQDCTFIGTTGAAGSYVSSNAGIDIEPNVAGDLCTNILVTDCLFRNIGSAGIAVSNNFGTQTRGNVIANCVFLDDYLDGVHLNGTLDTTVTGCVFRGNLRSGVYITSGATQTTRAIISGNQIFDNNGNVGNRGQIYVENALDTLIVNNRIGMTTATGTAPAVEEAGTANRTYIANNNLTSSITVTVTLVGASSVTIGNTGLTNIGRQCVLRYALNATVNITNSSAGTYVDFGGSFTKAVTTLSGDEVILRVNALLKKVTAGQATIVVDRGGTKLPVAAGGACSVTFLGNFVPAMFEYVDTPGAGTFTYKPQLYTDDANTATVGAGQQTQYIVEVWR